MRVTNSILTEHEFKLEDTPKGVIVRHIVTEWQGRTTAARYDGGFPQGWPSRQDAKQFVAEQLRYIRDT